MKEIFERRSIRKFTEERISEEELEKLLRAAMRAPSACNEQPWEFVVVTGEELIARIRDSQKYTAALSTAPMVIAVCGDTEKLCFSEYDYWVQDCSAAIENLLLEAVHMGLGAVWMGVYPVPERVENIKSLLSLPRSVIPLGLVAVGRPAERPAPIDTFLPLRIHREHW